MKNKVIQNDEFIVKESRRYNILVLINHHQDFKNDDTKYSPINDGCLIKYKNKGRNYVYTKERTKEHMTAQSLNLHPYLRKYRMIV